MESSIKINSISIDLADAADEVNAGKCEHFSIRGFVAEIRERDHKKCWPFSEDSVELRNHQSYCLPTLPVVKSRWWRCSSCIKDINVKEINDNDCRLQSQSMPVKERKLDAGSSAIPSRKEQNSLFVTDKKQKKNDVQTAKLLKKVRRRDKDASKVKSKNSNNLLGRPEQASKRSKEKAVNGGEAMEAAVTAFGSFDIAGVVDDTPDKTIKKNGRYSDNVSPVSRNLLRHRKTRKIRLLSELLSNRNEETPSKRESVRGRKRKSCGDQEESRPVEMNNYASRILSTIGKTSENASKSCDSEENTVSGAESSRRSVQSQSTDSGFERVAIKGKQRNKRFQVVEDRFQETSTKDPYDYGSSPVPGKDLVPCTLHTQRTEKDLSVAKKRKRKALTDNEKSTVINFSNSMDDVNLVNQRKPDSFQRDSMPQSTRDFLNSKWLDCSYPKLDDRPVFPLPLQERMQYKEDDHRAMLKGLTNHFRNFGSSFNKPTDADGCLRSGENINFSNNGDSIRSSSSLNDKLRYTSSTNVAGSSCALQKDIYQANGKGKEVAVQELPGASRIQSKTSSEQIDDIPMEIVELMAKNQYERCLPDREEDKQPSQAATTTSVSKNALLIDLNETYDNTMDNTLRGPPNPLGSSNNRNGDLLTGKPNSLDLFSTSHFVQPYNVPSGFRIPPPLTGDNQSRSIQFSGSVGQSSHNCHWLGNVTTAMANQQNPSPSSFRVLRACNTCQSVQQQQQYREASHPTWPPPSMTSQHAHKPVSLSMPQKIIDQSTKLDNPTTRNLNFGGDNNGKQKLVFEGVSSKPMDTYSNESSIPAMHLLSLMDPRLRSNIPTDTNFVKPPFSPVNQSKELTGPQQGDCSKTAYAVKHWPFDLYSSRVTTPETCRENFAVIPPAVGASSFSLQREKSSAEKSDFTFRASWNLHHQEKKDNNFVAPIYNNNNSHHQKPIFTSSSSGSDPGKFQLLGASDSMMLPLKFHMTDNAKKQKTKKAQRYNPLVSACPPTSTFGPFVCSFNRNPADFTIPDAPGNVYMLKGDDFKVKKQAGLKKKPSLCKQDALKQNKKPLAPDAENA